MTSTSIALVSARGARKDACMKQQSRDNNCLQFACSSCLGIPRPELSRLAACVEVSLAGIYKLDVLVGSSGF